MNDNRKEMKKIADTVAAAVERMLQGIEDLSKDNRRLRRQTVKLEEELEKVRTHTFVDIDEAKQHDLLKRYIQHVYDEEGSTFIWTITANCSHSESKFTEEESNLLERLGKEVVL